MVRRRFLHRCHCRSCESHDLLYMYQTSIDTVIGRRHPSCWILWCSRMCPHRCRLVRRFQLVYPTQGVHASRRPHGYLRCPRPGRNGRSLHDWSIRPGLGRRQRWLRRYRRWMDVSHLPSFFPSFTSTPLTLSRDRNWIQLPKQIAWIAVSFAWVFAITYILMFIINLIPGCHFRSTEEAEIVGMDEVELGEYVVDYAYHDRDLEGNCPFPPRQVYSPGGHSNEKAQNLDPNSISNSNESTLNRQASPRHDIEGSHSHAQEVYPAGGRGEGRMMYSNGDEQVTAKHG